MIPKVIHYCWFGGKPLPKDTQRLISTWKKFCPDFKIIQWNEDNFNFEDNQFAQEAYRQRAWAFVSDYARLKVIYEHGGIYLDTDVELLKKLDFLLTEKAFFSIQQKDGLVNTGLGFGAEAKNLAVGKMLAGYDDLAFEPGKASQLACPILNTESLSQIGFEPIHDVTRYQWGIVFPPEYADPLSPGCSSNLVSEKTFSIHHYSASWTSPLNQYKLKLYNLIGLDNITRIKKALKGKPKE